MADIIVDSGRDIIEEGIINGLDGDTLDTVAVGDGTSSPSSSDTLLTNNLHETSPTVNKTATDGEISFVFSVTGGTEVPGGAELTEFGIKLSDGRLFYYEVRSSPIQIADGETKQIKIVVRLEDTDVESNVAITNDGRNYVRDVLVGDTTNTIDQIHIGSSESDVSQSDSTMFDTVYIANRADSNVSIEETTAVGEPRFVITLAAGPDADDQLADGTDVSEFGLVVSTSDTLFLHETRPTIVMQGGDEKSFSIPVRITQ